MYCRCELQMVSDEANNGLLPRANVSSLFELAGIKCQSTPTDIGTMNLFADQRVSERGIARYDFNVFVVEKFSKYQFTGLNWLPDDLAT